MVDGKLVADNVAVAELLADKFELASSDDNYSKPFLDHKRSTELEELQLEDLAPQPINDLFEMSELAEVLAQSRNSSPGPDDIPLVFLQHLSENGKSALLKIYNCIWASHNFPTIWSTATVLPLLQPQKEKTDINSYRPISLTCCSCKIMEKMINRRLQWYLEKNELLDPYQSGFRQRRSTTDNIIQLESAINTAFAYKQKVLAVFFDLEKAYDMVWRHKILKILSQWGLTGNLAYFVNNFLKNRSFMVRVNNCLSSPRTLQNGIPQGAVLSVTLFLIAINDILRSIPKPVRGSLFADDLVAFVSGTSVATMKRLMQNLLVDLGKWSSSNGLRFSVAKTKCILFTKRKHDEAKPLLYMNGQTLTFVSTVKFLGVIFDEGLTWKAHIDHLKRTCSRLLDLLKVLAHQTWGADAEVLLRVYRQMIRPHFDYGAAAYSSCKKSFLQPLRVLQNSAVRVALGAFRTSPIESMLRLANETPIEDRLKLLRLSYYANTCRNPGNPNAHTISNSTTVLSSKGNRT